MKKVFFILLSLILTFNLFSQARVNAERPVFLQEESYTLTEAVGWRYYKSIGEWISNNNVITVSKNSSGSVAASQALDNFKSMQIRTISYQNVRYYLLIINKWRGYWRYPNIKEDWIVTNAFEGYIFSANEYDKLKNIEGLITPVALANVDLTYCRNDNERLDKIIEVLLRPSTVVYIFPILKSEEGNIRFNLPNMVSNPSNRNSYYGYPFNFDESYFETDLDNFNRILYLGF